MHSFFLIATFFQGFISQSIGIYAILKGGYKPARMTRFIYLLMTLLIIGVLFAQGSYDALILACVQGIGTIIIFALSLKYGMGGTSKLDKVTLAGFLISLVVWKITSNPTLALYLSILTDLIGFVPTFAKTWNFPDTEDWRFYFSDVLAGLFSLLSLTILTIENIVFPLYIFALNLFAVILILGRKKVLKNPKV